MRQLRRRGLKAITQPATTALTTAARARAALPAAGLSADNAILGGQIDALSAAICGYLRIPATLDGKVTLGSQRVLEKIDIVRGLETFYLSRAPVMFVSAVAQIHLLTLDDEVLLATELEILSDDGLVRFLDDDGKGRDVSGTAIIEYTAGYSLPSNDPAITNAALLPVAIEQAMFLLLKGQTSVAKRDPTIRSESSDEVDSFTYFSEGGMAVAWREAAAYLDAYRRIIRS